MSQLILTLSADAADPGAVWECLQSPQGQTVARHSSAPLALLPRPDRRTEVVAVVPLAWLSWHRVTLPPGSLARGGRGLLRLRAILEGLLEERLLDEAHSLHLALQPQAQAGAPQWVAVCERERLVHSVRALQQAGYPVARIVPESTPEALVQAALVLGEAEQPMLAAALGSPAAGEAGLVLAPLTADTAPWVAAEAAVWAEPAVVAAAEAALQRPVRLVQRSERLLQAAQSPWNLAQFDLAALQSGALGAVLWNGLKGLATQPVWRPARWALAALVLGNLAVLNAWAWRTDALLRQQQAQIRQVLTQTFPKVAVVVDAPLQMARELEALRRGSALASREGLEPLLSVFSAAAPADWQPDAIEYGEFGLRVSGRALAAADQSRLMAALQQQGVQARIQGAQWQLQWSDSP